MEGDLAFLKYGIKCFSFQSTPSAWRETSQAVTPMWSSIYFNPLPPHGGRPFLPRKLRKNSNYFNPLPPHGGRPIRTKTFDAYQCISIHSLRMEGDVLGRIFFQCCVISIHSLRMEGDCPKVTVKNRIRKISIHSLRMEGDLLWG